MCIDKYKKMMCRVREERRGKRNPLFEQKE